MDQRREYVWSKICREFNPNKTRFLLSDIYANIILYPQEASPREKVVNAILNGFGTQKDLLRICQNGVVLDSLCWVRSKFPDLLKTDFDPEFVPEEFRNTPRALEQYQLFVKSVQRWLDAWGMFVEDN